MAKPARRHMRRSKSRLPELPNIGPGSRDAMRFRKLAKAGHSFKRLVEFENALLRKPVNDLSDLQRIAEIARYYTETEGMMLEDFFGFGAPEAAGPRLIFAVIEYAKKQSAEKAAAKVRDL